MENEKPEEKERVRLLNGFTVGLGEDGKPHFEMFAEDKDSLNGVVLLGLAQYAEAQVRQETGLDPSKFIVARLAMLESALAETIKSLQAFTEKPALWTPNT